MKFFCAVTACVIALSLCSCGSSTEEDEIVVPILETAEIQYNTCKAEIGEISEKYYSDASYDYPYSQSVTVKKDGQIKSIEVEAPCDVKEGDLLFTLYSDDAEEELEEEEIRLNQAKSTVATLKDSGADANEIQLAEYDLEIEQLKYDHIKESLDDYNVYAPCDGELKLNQNGQLNINSPVYKGMVIGYTIDKTQKYLCASIHNTALNNVNFGTLVTLQQGANSATGMVTDIIYVENGDYSTYNYVITPDENDFLDSEPISVIFDVYSREDTVVIPAEAVKTLSDRTYVNLLVDGVKIEQDIELGIENGDSVEVISGLSGDEEIILN